MVAGAAAGGAVGVLAACATPGAQQPAAESAPPVTLQWMTDWTGGARLEATKQTQPLFEAEHPKIKLEPRPLRGRVPKGVGLVQRVRLYSAPMACAVSFG